MDDGELLLLAVLAEPGDDTARLVYADYLEEHGECDRAEFVRVQCELARKYPSGIDDRLHCLKPLRAGLGTAAHGLPKGLPVAVCGKCEVCAEMTALRRRERALLLPHWRGWFLPGRHQSPALRCLNLRGKEFDRNDGPPLAYTFSRGFVESIKCTAADWLAHAGAITAAHPVTAVVLTTVPWEPLPDGMLSVLGGLGILTPDEPALHFADYARRWWPGINFSLPSAAAG